MEKEVIIPSQNGRLWGPTQPEEHLYAMPFQQAYLRKW